MKHKLTALQYLQLIQSLPNPQYHYDNKREPRVRVAYLPQTIDQPVVSVAFPNQAPTSFVEAKTVEFELVPNYNVWFWQPVDEIVITPVEKGPARKNW
jgi:hypothetical protein